MAVSVICLCYGHFVLVPRHAGHRHGLDMEESIRPPAPAVLETEPLLLGDCEDDPRGARGGLFHLLYTLLLGFVAIRVSCFRSFSTLIL